MQFDTHFYYFAITILLAALWLSSCHKPTDPSGLFSKNALAMEYRKDGMIEVCVHELSAVLRQDANYLEAYYHLGTALNQIGDSDEALLLFKKGIERAEQKGDTHSAIELQEALAMMELELE
jgi:Tfp pilus assembly protein PilF